MTIGQVEKFPAALNMGGRQPYEVPPTEHDFQWWWEMPQYKKNAKLIDIRHRIGLANEVQRARPNTANVRRLAMDFLGHAKHYETLVNREVDTDEDKAEYDKYCDPFMTAYSYEVYTIQELMRHRSLQHITGSSLCGRLSNAINGGATKDELISIKTELEDLHEKWKNDQRKRTYVEGFQYQIDFLINGGNHEDLHVS